MAKKLKLFPTEADLCAAFTSAVKGWTVYAESAGWDLLLVRSDGYQLGIQAKLRLNVDVINQAIEEGQSWSAELAGPDFRAVMVPWEERGGFDTLAGYAGITIIRVVPQEYKVGHWGCEKFRPALPAAVYQWEERTWFECCPSRRHELPEYIPDVVGGRPAPIQLTKWKIAAIKLVITLEDRGYVTRADFKHLGIDYRRWIAPGSGWLSVDGQTYVRGPRMPDFVGQHPVVYQATQSIAELAGAELREKLENPLKFQWGTGGAEQPPATIHGFNVTLLIDLCNAIISAEGKGQLSKRYNRLARQAHIINGASAKSQQIRADQDKWMRTRDLPQAQLPIA